MPRGAVYEKPGSPTLRFARSGTRTCDPSRDEMCGSVAVSSDLARDNTVDKSRYCWRSGSLRFGSNVKALGRNDSSFSLRSLPWPIVGALE